MRYKPACYFQQKQEDSHSLSSLAADDAELTCSVLLLGTTLASTEQASSFMKAGLHSALKGTTVMDSIHRLCLSQPRTLMANCWSAINRENAKNVNVSSYGEDAAESVRMTHKTTWGRHSFPAAGGAAPQLPQPHTGDGIDTHRPILTGLIHLVF